MKTITKLFLLFILLTIAVSSANAQAHHRRNIYGDFFVGMTMASMDMEKQNEYKKYKIGFMVGGNVNFRFFRYMEFQTGLQLLKKGSLKHKKGTFPRQDLPDEIVDVKTTIDANYMQIPLNLGFEVPLTKELYFNMHVGVYGAYGFKGYRDRKGFTIDSGSGEEISQDQSQRETFDGSSLKRWDYGIGGNIGFVYDIYILRLQYDHGLADIATNNISNLSTDSEGHKNKWRTRNYSICLGFRF